MRLTATYPKLESRSNVATFTWSDGLVAQTLISNTTRHLPHDLAHYIVESRAQPPYGFWAMVGRQAPFESLTLIKGRWPKGKRDWFERVKRKHRDEMVQAEGVGGVIDGLVGSTLDLDRDWTVIQRGLRAHAIKTDGPFASLTKRDLSEIVEFHRQLHALWDGIAVGQAVAVSWPPDVGPAVVGP